MKIIYKEGKTIRENIQKIIVDENDKYGVAMLAYFRNMLRGQNVEKLAVKDASQVQLFHDRVNKTYTLQILRMNIDKDCILKHYDNFKKKYDILIKDKISWI